MTLFSYVLRQSAKRMPILIPLLAASPLAVQAQVAFSPPQNVSSNPGTSYLSQIAVDSTGSINIVWLDNTPGNYDIFFSRSSDGGATFSTPENLSNDPGDSENPQIVVDSTGNINVVWQDNTPGNWQILFTRSSDGGATFSTPKNISNDPRGAGNPYMAVDSGGNINVAWVSSPTVLPNIISFSRSSDGGATFSTPIALSTRPSGGPQVAVDSAGNINVAWRDGYNNFDVAFSRSSDGGATFTTPQVISYVMEADPELYMALDSHGNIYVVWDTQPYGNIYLSHSSDGGATFTYTTITNNTGPVGPRDAQIAIDSSGNINVIWPDNSPGNNDIFFTRSVSLSALRVDPSSVTGGDSSTGTVTLTAPAPAGGAQVALSSSDPSVASVPDSVAVPAGATSASFTVTTSSVSTSTPVTISGSYSGSTQAASLTVTPPTLTSLSLNASSVTARVRSRAQHSNIERGSSQRGCGRVSLQRQYHGC